MRKIWCRLICAYAVAVLVLHPCVSHAQADVPDANGEAVAVDASTGEKVEIAPAPPPSETGPRRWPWIVGIVAAAGGGWWLADELDDADSNNEDASTAGAAAEEDAAGAADDAAAAAAAADAAEAAAEDAATTTPEEDPTYTVHLSGTFTGDEMAYDGNPSFKPSMSFSYISLGTTDGNIDGYIESTDGGTNTVGGTYKQAGDKSVLIVVPDEFYSGQCSVINQGALRLQNGRVLEADGGAAAYLIED